MDILKEGKRVFDVEIDALNKIRDLLDDSFVNIVNEIVGCEGKVIVTGIGKPGHIAKKMAATFSSLGTPSFYLHPAESMHGDLGMIEKKDIVFVISYSGESDEVIHILPNIKLIGAKIIALTANEQSTLADNADLVQIIPKIEEACTMGLAPTSSTTVELCYGDALAVVASQIYGFNEQNFGKYHPAGALGKRLLIKVKDLMSQNEKNAYVDEDAILKDAIIELGKKGLGMVSVVNKYNELVGIITDGDLRRQLENGASIYELVVKDVMTNNPVTVDANTLAAEALRILKEKNISGMPVVKDNKLIGAIRLQDILAAGIVCMG